MSPPFRFAAAVSSRPTLFDAIAEVVSSCKEQLAGHAPSFCQLLLTPGHARNVALGQRCLIDKLTQGGVSNSETLPVVMGGVLQSLGGPAGAHIPAGASGVSLFAASMPGVEVMPFHVDTPALPQLSAQQWARLLANVSHRRPRARSRYSSTHIHVDSDSESDSDATSSSSSSSNSTAAIMLSSPHFVELERLLQRFSNVLPGTPMLGGVSQKGAWGETEHEFGALFLGNQVYCQGAVGTLLHGPFALQHLLVPGCQPAAGCKVMTVTQASGNVILSLDGQPVRDVVAPFIHSLSAGGSTASHSQHQHQQQLYLGINEVGLCGSTGSLNSYDPRLFVPRPMELTTDTSSGQTVLVVATNEVPVGSRVKLLVQDFQESERQQHQQLQHAVAQLGPIAAADHHQIGLLGYSCATLPGDDGAQLVQDVLGEKAAFAGSSVKGEFAGPAAAAAAGSSTPADEDGPAEVSPPVKLHTFSASMGVICHRDLLQQQQNK